MTRSELLQKVGALMSSPSVRIVATADSVRVFKMCFNGPDFLAMVLYDDAVEFDGIRHDLREESEEGGD